MTARCPAILSLTTIVFWMVATATTSGQDLASLIERANSDALAALKGNDIESAKSIAGQLIEQCNNAQGESEDAIAKGLLLAIEIDFPIKNFKRASETCDVLASRSEKASSHWLDATAWKIKIKSIQNVDAADDVVALLTNTARLGDDLRSKQHQYQDIAFNAISSRFQLSELPIDELGAKISTLEQSLIQNGVSLPVAAMARLSLAQSKPLRNDAPKMQELLNSLAPAIKSERISIRLRAQYWNLVALTREKRRQYSGVFDALREFETLTGQLDDSDATVAIRNQRALNLLRIGDYSAARTELQGLAPLHERLLRSANSYPQLVNRLGNSVFWAINDAKALEGLNQYREARNPLLDARKRLTDFIKAFPQSEQDIMELVASVENNLATNHYLTGELDEAEELFARVASIHERMNVPADRRAETDINLGWIAMSRGEYAIASERFNRAARVFGDEVNQSGARHAEALTYLSRSKLAESKKRSAKELIQNAIDVDYRQVVTDLSATASTRDRIAIIQESRVHPESPAWPGALDTYLELADELGIPAAEQYSTVLEWKGLLRRFSANRDRATLRQERQLLDKLRDAYHRKVSIFKRRALLEEIKSLESELRELRRSRSSHTMNQAERIQDTDLETIAEALRPGELFLDFFQFRRYRAQLDATRVGAGREYLAFAINSSGNVARISFGVADEIDSEITQWIEVILQASEPATVDRWNQHLRELADSTEKVSQFLQAPIKKVIQSQQLDLQRLSIRPDGRMHLVPWSALPGLNGGDYWVEEISFRTFDSVPNRSSASSHLNPTLLSVGGVEFGELQRKFPPLQGSENESNVIARLFKQRFPEAQQTQLKGSKATKATLKNSLPNARYVHLATHGFYHRGNEQAVFEVTDATTRLKTGLVVAADDAIGKSNQQYLSADEISELDLSSVELVVLSACESALGKAQAGQGVVGLPSSFHQAGAAKVIGSLWVVDDDSTVQLMRGFLNHYWNSTSTMDTSAAFRTAQLEMLRSTSSPDQARFRRHPYAWAAFTCSTR